MCHRHYCLLLLQPLIQILPLLTTELLGQLLCKQEQSLHGLKQTGVTCTVTVCKQKYFLIKGCQFIVNPFNVLYYNIGKNEFEKVGFRKHSLFIMRKKQTNKQKASLRMCSTNCNSNNLNFLSEEIFPSLQYFQISFDCTEQFCKILSHLSLERSHMESGKHQTKVGSAVRYMKTTSNVRAIKRDQSYSFLFGYSYYRKKVANTKSRLYKIIENTGIQLWKCPRMRHFGSVKKKIQQS